MRTWFRRIQQGSRVQHRRQTHLVMEALERRAMMDAALGFVESNLASDTKGVPPHTDTDLINPWGFSETHGGRSAPASVLSSTEHDSVVGQLATTSHQSFSTIPANGDLNPYGVAFVPQNFARGGSIHAGDILVSNFNNSAAGGNLQGMGTTITRVTPDGHTSTFFQGSPGLGLTTALGVLSRGFVIVGNVPTTDGTGGTAQQGSLLIIDKNGHQVATLADPKLLDGPWDLTVHDEGSHAEVFVSNVLTGTVTRLDLEVPARGNHIEVESMVQIASGYTHRTDPSALLLGPTGLAYDERTDTLYVASTADNAIYSISHAAARRRDAGKGHLVYQDDAHLHGPLGLLLAPNGNLIVANGDAVNVDPNHVSELVEFTPQGKFVSQFSLDPNVDAPFGIALSIVNGKIRFAAVNDNQNTVEVWALDI
jgi:hypothetical protein